jgi:hypothetical protein
VGIGIQRKTANQLVTDCDDGGTRHLGNI